MVTHGYVVFKYKGIYYTFYNHSDSYFEHLGNLVVDEINSMINNFFIYNFLKFVTMYERFHRISRN